MNQGVVLYRGSLKSCNYQCSYCPFSKHRISQKELDRDREAWFRFVGSLVERKAAERGTEGEEEQLSGNGNEWDEGGKAEGLSGNGDEGEGEELRGMMVVPYGEALIHSWYWQGLAELSRIEGMDVVGAQTNLSFPLERSLEYFDRAGGRREKLRLWGTFHPEMIGPRDFAEKCRQVKEEGIALCGGAVGVPENLEQIRSLRSLLPEDIYLWINKMDGLGREYTKEERDAFLEVDPYFWRELIPVPADVSRCRGRIFLESDGRRRICNISRIMPGNWYETGIVEEKETEGEPETIRKAGAIRETETVRKGGSTTLWCGRKRCSCYLAYGGRENFMNEILFGPYPIFRIPRRPKAVFLDIVGTLVEKESVNGNKELQKGFQREYQGESGKELRKEPQILPETKLALKTLAQEGTLLFWATTLQEKDARKVCGETGQLFLGGIFAGGAHISIEWEGRRRESIYRLDCGSLSGIKALERELAFRTLIYQKEGVIYKVTLSRPRKKPWKGEEVQALEKALEPRYRSRVRWIREDHCLQLVAKEATKANGVQRICEWLEIPLSEIGAAGDSPEDEEMMELSDCRSWYVNSNSAGRR